mmetsp:Transcript_12346/g.30244  ORF Transcript_12346/g.30244 Transcript_12346/m.30244 type:complete len:202 (+) Transcript_12346:1593-2198(+)
MRGRQRLPALVPAELSQQGRVELLPRGRHAVHDPGVRQHVRKVHALRGVGAQHAPDEVHRLGLLRQRAGRQLQLPRQRVAHHLHHLVLDQQLDGHAAARRARRLRRRARQLLRVRLRLHERVLPKQHHGQQHAARPHVRRLPLVRAVRLRHHNLGRGVERDAQLGARRAVGGQVLRVGEVRQLDAHATAAVLLAAAAAAAA